MKTTLFLSSLFFLLGLKISNLIDLPGKANAVDKIIVNKIINSKPVKALPLFKDDAEEAEVKEDKTQAEPGRPVEETQSKPEGNL